MTNVSEKDLIDVVSYLTNKPNDDCAEIVKTVFDVMFDNVISGNRIIIPNFGVFEIEELVPERKLPSFIPSHMLVSEVNGASHDI